MNKRNLCSQIAEKSGVLLAIETLAKRDCVLVLNYHRIGDAQSTELDTGVFSATADAFEAQISYLRRRYSIVNLDEAVSLTCGCRKSRGVKILLTFDDGYKDNYELAFPILRSVGVPAAFFIISSYLDQPTIPWWDSVAYWVRHCRAGVVRLTYPEPREFALPPGRREDAIKRLLQFFKSPKMKDQTRFLAELELACGPGPALPSPSSLFLNRLDALEMIRGGMSFGSQTCTHRILAQLPRSEQLSELSESRKVLSRELGIKVDTLAYPVGGQNSFSQTTRSLLDESGYRAAFSYYGGLNQPGDHDPFDIKRVGIETGNPTSRFRLQTSMAIAGKGFWF